MSVNEGRVIDIHAVINILFDQATSKDTDEPVISLTGITAAYTQSGAVYPDTPLNDLKDDLVVTAIYSDESTEVLPASDYTLTGTLTVGSSVITAAYQGKTDTFNVTVTAALVPAYELPDTPVVFDGTNYVNTLYKLMETDQTFTILISWKNGDMSAIDRAALFHCLNEQSPYQGLSVFQNNTGDKPWMLAGQSANATPLTGYTTAVNGENKIAIRHEAGSITYLVDGTSDGTRQSQITSTRGKNPYLCNYDLWIGRNRVNAGRTFIGAVYDFKIYESYLSDSDVTSYLGS